jgi:DNA-binding NarL/FixJ family response regulator
MNKILVVDDHAIIRKGIISILAEHSDIIVICDEAANAQEALEKISLEKYSMVLLDISMPGLNGMELLNHLHRDHPKLPVLVLSMHSEEQYGIRSLTLGAFGYLTKDRVPAELISAVKKVLAGKHYISSSLAEKMAIHLGSGRQTCNMPHESLSKRELQILRLIGIGKSSTQMSNDLFLSVKTISTYRSRILGKLNMKSNAEIINYAIKYGLLD